MTLGLPHPVVNSPSPLTEEEFRHRLDQIQQNFDKLDISFPVSGANIYGFYQPLDADLTSIAALATTGYGRSFLTLANSAAALLYFGGAPLASPTFTGTPAAPTASAANNTTQIATTAFVQSVIAALSLSSTYQPLDSDLTAIAALTTTSFGRSFLALADAAAGRTLLGLGSLATLSTITSSEITDGTIANVDISTSAAIAYSKLALTGAILNADLAGSIAYSKLVLTGSVTNADLAGSIANTKLATDPLARANHTGTQLASTVSNFDTQVRTSTLNQMATPTTDLPIGSHKITGLTAGTATGHAVEYDQLNTAVSAATSGLSLKNPVALATTVNLTTTSTTSSTLVGSAPLVIDGSGVNVNDRILVKNQTAGADNGIYYVSTDDGGTFGGGVDTFGGGGTFGGTASWTLTRATDADTSAEVVTGMFVPVTAGSTNLQTSWILTTPATITLATTSLVFARWTATPVGTAGGDLTGSYPNPTLAAGKRDFGLVTALPGSPSTGDRCTYTDSLTSPTYTWRLQYNGSDSGSFKWEFLGGSPLRREVDTDESTTSAVFIALTTACSVTAPLAGDYDITHGGEAYLSAAAPAATIQTPKVGAAAAADADGVTATPQAINAAQTGTRKRRKTGLSASTAIALQHRTTSGTCQWRYRWVEIQPVRVG